MNKVGQDTTLDNSHPPIVDGDSKEVLAQI
jgi:hypothetical protein